jgi:hypothetical protein
MMDLFRRAILVVSVVIVELIDQLRGDFAIQAVAPGFRALGRSSERPNPNPECVKNLTTKFAADDDAVWFKSELAWSRPPPWRRSRSKSPLFTMSIFDVEESFMSTSSTCIRRHPQSPDSSGTMVASSLPSKASRQAAISNSAASQIAKITEYETQLTSAAKKTEFNPNPLIPLTALARHESAEVVHKAVWALYRAWVKILSDGHLVPTPAGGQGDAARTKSGSEDESPEAAAAAVQKWMMERLNEYLEILAGLLRDSEPSLRVSFRLPNFRQIILIPFI